MKSKYLTDLVDRCMKFVDKNGQTAGSESNMFFDWTRKEVCGDLRMHCYALQSPHSEGFFRIEIREGKILVLNAKGDYSGKPSNVDVEFYKPGGWEKRV